MNGFFLCTILILIISSALRRRGEPMLRDSFWRDLQRCLRQRDYLFRSLPEGGHLERRLTMRLIAELRKGQLHISDLQRFEVLFAKSRERARELSQLAWTYTVHLSFVVLVPLLFRMILGGRYWFDRRDAFELLLAILGLGAGGFLLQKAWPQPPLGREEDLWGFVLAFLGERDCGQWASALEALRRSAWLSGIDCTEERKRLLTESYFRDAELYSERLNLFEEYLGPLELAATCYFSSILAGVPLLNHFSGLVG